ncbi:NfeD family protein [Variovorax saccharolyticus]|uniref:NfeD family protein n=1 Tax=Variovorax saccharolyticus TaxID=3053516 RepID=UPI0025786DBC|nr:MULTISPECIES: NfeD family protein [unclassified Variovorax]MDM0020737.1 NfeD family protein [Variovorax sp. J22R187]MDM0025676.1 NfeD family protein [Variovorax sp. J31P216]
MTAPTVWWLMTFALVALELVTGTIYALLVAIGFAVGALAAHLGAAMPTQIVCAAVACVAFVGGWYLRSSRHPKARLADMQIDVGEQVTVAAWSPDRTTEVRYRGATWQAKPLADAPTLPGLHRIVDVQGNFLVVEFIG